MQKKNDLKPPYENVRVSRQIDKKSQSHPTLIDRLRSLYLRKTLGLDCGKSTIFKKNVTLSISKKGALKIGDHCLFHQGVSILLTLPSPHVAIGNWVFIGRDTIIASKISIEIGDFTVFAPRCYVIDHEHGFQVNNLILNQKSVLNSVSIGRDCYFGTGAVVTSGVTVGDGAIVGANSVVVTDIPAGEVWAGVPARYIRNR
jgi:acetyltransferase-like isoleucine patch superfamily enzyme